MNALGKLWAAYSGLTAAAVGINVVIAPLYADRVGAVWDAFNWFMAPAALGALIVYAREKLRPAPADGADLRRYVNVNVGFYAALVMTVWFYSNWFTEFADEDATVSWTFVNALFLTVVGSAAVRVWRACDPAERPPSK